MHKTIAFITGGNRDLQVGDRPVESIGFMHYFSAPDEVFDEMREAGLCKIESFSLNGGEFLSAAGIV